MEGLREYLLFKENRHNYTRAEQKIIMLEMKKKNNKRLQEIRNKRLVRAMLV